MTVAVDCQAVADEFRAWVKAEAGRLPFKPRLATILYRPGADPGSVQYRDFIVKDAATLGVEADAVEAEDEDGLLRAIERANADHGVHGVMVFYPLRSGLKDEEVMDLVSPYKDAEGLHALNLGYLVKYRRFLDEAEGLKCIVPATAKAAVKALQAYPEVRIEGAYAVVVNNSMRVGKPLGLMLENLGATVTKCYHRTRPEVLERSVRSADILVTAVPDAAFRLDPDWVKPGAAVLDLSHQGNIDAAALQGRAKLATLPENRLGKVTRAMMFVNLIYCARYKGAYY